MSNIYGQKMPLPSKLLPVSRAPGFSEFWSFGPVLQLLCRSGLSCSECRLKRLAANWSGRYNVAISIHWRHYHHNQNVVKTQLSVININSLAPLSHCPAIKMWPKLNYPSHNNCQDLEGGKRMQTQERIFNNIFQKKGNIAMHCQTQALWNKWFIIGPILANSTQAE